MVGEAEQEFVRSWRFNQLLGLQAEGHPAFTVVQAEQLTDAGADWREVQALLAAGCPPKTVLRILI